MNGGRSTWAITPEERAKHDKQFESLSPALGYISGDQARKFFLLSGLPAPVLAEIWMLADVTKDGKMDRLEFSIAMKLIKLRLQGQALPSALPLIMKQPPAPSASPSPAVPSARFGMGSLPNLSVMAMMPPVPILAPVPMSGSLTSLSSLGGRIPLVPPLVPAGVPLPRYPSLSYLAVPAGGPALLHPSHVPCAATLPVSGSLSSPMVVPSPETAKAQSLLELGSGSLQLQPAALSTTSLPALASNSPKTGLPDWAVPQASRLKYRQHFNSLDKNMSGFLSGPQVRSALAASHLTQTQLATIWNLADVDKDGRLSAEEFILAMHLVDMAKLGLPLPLTLPVDLIPPSLREGKSGEVVNGTAPSPYLGVPEKNEALQKAKSNVTFEDRRKENFDRGHAELERRRQALLEQQRREEELRAPRRELERQRKLEWEQRRRQELLSQRNQEQEDIVRLKAKKRSLELELEAVGDKHKQISDRLRDVQSKRRIQKGELDLVNQRRDRSMTEINSLQQQFEDCQRKLSQLVPEQQKLSEKLRNMGLSNLPSSTMTMLKKSVSEKNGVCRKLKEQLEALERETSSKLSEMDQYNQNIKELRESQRKQQFALDKLCAIKEDKLRELERRREEELEKKRREEEEAERRAKLEEEHRRRLQEEREAALREEEERRRQEKLKEEEEAHRRRLQQELEAKQREEEERQRQEKLKQEEEARQRRLQEEVEGKRREEEELKARLQAEKEQQERSLAEEEERRCKAEEEERKRQQEEEEKRRQWAQEVALREMEERKKLEEERKKLEEERKRLEEERRRHEEERKKQEEMRKRQEDEMKREEEERRRKEERTQEEEKKKQDEEIKKKKEEKKKQDEEVKRKEEEKRKQDEEMKRKEKEKKKQEEEEKRKQEEEVKKKEKEKKKQEEEIKKKEKEKKKQEEEKKRQEEEAREEERKRVQQEEESAARQKEEPVSHQKPPSTKTNIKGKVAALLKGIEERKGAKRAASIAQRKSAALVTYRALFTFCSRSGEELGFEAGDLIEVDESAEGEKGWLYGSVRGTVGWFPVSYVEKQPKADPSASAKPALLATASAPRSSKQEDESAAPEMSPGIASDVEQSPAPPLTPTPVPAPVPTPDPASDPAPTMASVPAEQEQVGSLQAQVLRSWTADEDSHLSVSKGNVVTVLEQQEDWWLGELNGVQGWFPASCAAMATADTVDADQQLSSADGYGILQSCQPEEFVALYTYDSPEPGDLTFSEGDTILVTEKGGDWWKGSIGDRSGVFPSNYVKPKETEVPDNTSRPAAPNKKPEIAQVTMEYTATGEDQLTLAPGQLILVLSKTPTGWWNGELQARGKKRQRGWFPVSHVKLLGSSSEKPTPTPAPARLCQVIALYDYAASSQDELNFASGQLINVLEQNDPHWWKGEINGVTGLFPTNYVKMATAETESSQQSSADMDALSLQEKKRQGYIVELIESEERHLEDLELALQVFHKFLSESGRLTEEELGLIFLNWQELITTSSKLLKALQERKRASGDRPVHMVGDVLASELSCMQAYIRFCSSQLKGAAMLQRKTDQDPEFKDFLKKIATDYRCKGMPLSSFLIKPMQRITRYPLIIKNIMESTPESHADHGQLQEALERAEELCSRVNEAVREKENVDRLEWLQGHVQCEGVTENLVFNSLTNCLGPRKLLHRGKLYKSKGSKEMQAFLFNDFLLLTHSIKQFSSSGSDKLFSPKCNTQFRMYRTPIFLNEVLVKLPSDPSSEEPIFHLSHINRVYTLKAETLNDRTTWVQKIKSASEKFIEIESKKREKTHQGRSPNDSGIGRLLITILEAIELKACKPNGKANPYCEVTMGEQCYVSRTLNDTLNPKWNFNCQFFIKDIYQDVLCITILEKDPFAPDAFLGRTEVPVATIRKELGNKGPANRRLLLQEVATGEVWVQLDLQLFDQKTST
ncbi:hypothetical protein MATL_G00155770 [Megalops atlanticus]|uniref:Osteoclast-stimulating factor 1 n=1 Tax=Megalops atlanticus TaxID=7932 RepID=A0A9D3PU00_MEGAT|nr:hypothetical protein MATL_G00155770 [Megalops atlanticus]